MTKQFNRGDTVRTVFGDVHTVREVIGCQVWLSNGDWAHPAKCFIIRRGGAS